MEKHNVTPRQRLVNLMYLVLLAMVAIDVPDSVLNSFKTIDESLKEDVFKTDNESNAYLAYFEQNKLKNDPNRAKPWHEKALQAKAIMDRLGSYIDSTRNVLIKEAGGYNAKTQDLNGRENTGITYQYFTKKKHAKALRLKIEQAKKDLLQIFPDTERNKISFKPEIKGSINTEGKKLEWEARYFGSETPLTAAIATLQLLRADVANTKNYAIKRLLGRLDKAVINVDQFMAVASAPSSYVLAGQPYQATVFLSSYDSQQKAGITVNGQAVPVVNGIGRYQTQTSRPGMYSWKGRIQVKQANGTYKFYETPVQNYQVAVPGVSIAAEKLNVVYAGVVNPISVAAAGVPNESIRVSLLGKGNIQRSGNSYNYTVGADGIGQTMTVNITATVNDRNVNLGKQIFRIKRIKDPLAKFVGRSSGSLSAVAIKQQDFIYANVEDFDFEAKFTIRRFSVTVLTDRREMRTARNTGADFNSEVKSLLAGVTAGNKLIFDNIFALGPEGKERLLNPIIINVN